MRETKKDKEEMKKLDKTFKKWSKKRKKETWFRKVPLVKEEYSHYEHFTPIKKTRKRFRIPVKTIAIIIILLLIGLYIYYNPNILDPIFGIIETPTETFVPSSYEEPPRVSLKPVINITELELQVFDLVNKEREKNALKPLMWDDTVAKFAREHSEDMMVNNYFSHEDSSGSDACDKMQKAHVIYWICGENIHQNSIIDYEMVNEYGSVVETVYKTQNELANEVVQGWMSSTGHRENILTNGFNRGGIGVAEKPNGDYYFTQDFIGRT